MPDQKLENLLNLAMNALPQERAKSENLNVGYDPTTRLWDVIVKYSGPESGLGGERIQVVPLLGSYAVVTLPETEISAYSVREQIEFIEKPKRLAKKLAVFRNTLIEVDCDVDNRLYKWKPTHRTEYAMP